MTSENLKEYKRLFDEAEAGGDSEHARFMLWMDEHRHEIRKVLLNEQPAHRYWYAGEKDCPPELKAGGELHTLKCKVCGLENPRSPKCSGLPNVRGQTCGASAPDSTRGKATALSVAHCWAPSLFLTLRKPKN